MFIIKRDIDNHSTNEIKKPESNTTENRGKLFHRVTTDSARKAFYIGLIGDIPFLAILMPLYESPGGITSFLIPVLCGFVSAKLLKQKSQTAQPKNNRPLAKVMI